MEGSVDELKAKIGVVRREAAFIFIFATVLLDMLAIGIVIPVLPKLVESFVDNDTASAARIFGLFGTAGTPPDIITKLNAEVTRIFADKEFRARFLDTQMFEPMPASPQAFADYIKTERAKWSKVIHDGNIKLE